MDDLKFSVSMCVYGKDNPEWFKNAVDSVLNQTIKPSEIVLVVDGPVSDLIEKVIQEYDSLDYFHVVRIAQNMGHGNARRIGLANCSNELVAIMDSDDISVPDRFEKQLKVFDNNLDVEVVGGQITEFIDRTDNIIGKRVVPLKDPEIKLYMKKRCPMNLVTVMFKKTSVEKVGGFIDWFCEEDYYLWLRMAKASMTFANVDETLVNVRVSKEMYQRRGGLKYFISEAKLQKYMMVNDIIGVPRYMINVSERLVLQVFMPNKIRGFIFQKFARSK